MESFECWGTWWNPLRPDEKVGGQLMFSPNSHPRLVTIGVLAAGFPMPEPIAKQIHGVSTEGTRISLLDCWDVTATTSTASEHAGSMTIESQFCVFGHHFRSVRMLNFDRIRVRFSMLESWVAQSGLAQTIQKDESSPARRVIAHYEAPVFPWFKLDGARVRIRSDGRAKQERYRSITLSERFFFEIRWPKRVNIFDFLTKECFLLQSFLTLALQYPVAVSELVGGNISHQVVKGRRRDLRVYYRQSRKIETERVLDVSEMLFPYSFVRETLQSRLARWLDIYERLDSVVDIFFEVTTDPTHFKVNTFLNIVQAVEVFHRRTTENRVLPKAEHKEMLQKL